MTDSRNLTESCVKNGFTAGYERGRNVRDVMERVKEIYEGLPQAQQQAHSQTFKAKQPTIPAILSVDTTLPVISVSEGRWSDVCRFGYGFARFSSVSAVSPQSSSMWTEFGLETRNIYFTRVVSSY
jgi:hypothetical protein